MMRATEIFAEQLLIGLMVLIIGILLFCDSIPEFPYGTDNVFGDFFFGFLILGGAYIVGMVYDRVADTLLQDLEQHNLLLFALEGHVRNGYYLPVYTDPLPLGRIRIRLLAQGKELASHGDYLRSRMRLTRATATLMPPLFLGLLLLHIHLDPWLRFLVSLLAITAYGVVLILKLIHIPKSPPKTYEHEKLKEYVEKHPGKSTNLRLHFRDLFLDPAIWCLGFLTVVGYVTAIASWWNDVQSPLLLLTYPVAGLLLALLIGWVWWRISETYFKFHLGFHKHVDDQS